MNALTDTPIAPINVQDRPVSDLGERSLIKRITDRLAMPSWVVVGPGDDAAVLEPERGALDVLTTDAQIEGVHFDHRFVPPEAIGYRALAVNLSDLAAMGAKPRAALLSLALPDTLDVTVLDRILDGLLSLAADHHVAVVGGNITRSLGPLMVDVTATGTVRPRRKLTRGGARPGDGLFVTGTIGSASVGLRALQQSEHLAYPASAQRFLRPEPRVRAGMMLGRNRAASACMDLSDGLADAVRQIAEASHVGIAIDTSALPIDSEVRHWHDAHGDDAIDAAIRGGEDYELLFTVRPAHHGRLRDVRKRIGGLRLTRIGVVTQERRLLLNAADGARELPTGFEHFR
jgi:thiamine-monophosphate kinase